MTTDPTTLWAVILVAGLGTLAFRLSFVMLFGRLETVPDRLAFLLRFVPAAVLAALVVPAVVAPAGTVFGADPPRLVAALVATGVAWRTRNLFATIVVGMATLWVVSALV